MDPQISNLVNVLKNSSQSNKVDALLDAFSNLIISQAIPCGYVFPNENDMCQYLSIGRGTLREVYKVLETKGYITRSKSGTCVRDIVEIAENGSFDSVLSIAQSNYILEFLLIVEPAAAALAAQKATDEEISQIHKKMMYIEQIRQDRHELLKANEEFHSLIREAAHNPLLSSSIFSSRKFFAYSVVEKIFYNASEYEIFISECLMQHYNLYYAILSRDTKKAGEIMREHVELDAQWAKKTNLKI